MLKVLRTQSYFDKQIGLHQEIQEILMLVFGFALGFLWLICALSLFAPSQVGKMSTVTPGGLTAAIIVNALEGLAVFVLWLHASNTMMTTIIAGVLWCSQLGFAIHTAYVTNKPRYVTVTRAMLAVCTAIVTGILVGVLAFA